MRSLVAKLLSYFREHKGEALTRDQLAMVVWGFMLDPRSRTIDQTVSVLRKELDGCERIETVQSVGYRYVKTAGRKES